MKNTDLLNPLPNYATIPHFRCARVRRQITQGLQDDARTHPEGLPAGILPKPKPELPQYLHTEPDTVCMMPAHLDTIFKLHCSRSSYFSFIFLVKSHCENKNITLCLCIVILTSQSSLYYLHRR